MNNYPIKVYNTSDYEKELFLLSHDTKLMLYIGRLVKYTEGNEWQIEDSNNNEMFSIDTDDLNDFINYLEALVNKCKDLNYILGDKTPE